MNQQQYKTGDILVSGISGLPIFNHYAIVLYKNGIGYVAQHTGYRNRQVIISGLDSYIENHEIKDVIASGITDPEYIYNKTKEINQQGKDFSLFGYNCEHFIREVCGCDLGPDQTKTFFSFMGVLLIISIIFFSPLK